ncbi:hypothetical protein Leryth_006902 [Lithospermum erythrorhizon]|nr:hypothetical protein Leryth_006902 [Lithospermum erythrorhizon]
MVMCVKHNTVVRVSALHKRKDEEEFKGGRYNNKEKEEADDVMEKVVCVTSGVSYLGIAIVKQLLLRGYYVRLILDNQEDVDKLREMQVSGEMSGSHNNLIEAVLAKLNDPQSLLQAFHGCLGVFHTSAFIDPAGAAGYSKHMVDVELNVSKNVMEACADTPTVKQCVFTSSLLASIWQQHNSSTGPPHIIDHNSWSDESICEDKKLWYALGKLRAEKVAWDIARERGVKLATICPGLITGPDFSNRNPTSTIAYLKGAKEMFTEGLLATVDVEKLAKAHVTVYEAMGKEASNCRYFCYDQIIRSAEDAQMLAREAEVDLNRIITPDQDSCSSNHPRRFKLSNLRLLRLMSTTARCCHSRE